MNVEYRGVNKDVWDLISKIYGGGPAIIRESLNIYSRDATKEALGSKSKGMFEFLPPMTQNNKDLSKSMNIFAKKDGSGSGDKNS